MNSHAFQPVISLGGRAIGPGQPVFVIAEAGVAHFGDPSRADRLVDMAAEAGADAFKTQAFVTDRLVAATLPEWRDRLRPKEVPFEFLKRMRDRCDRRGLMFLCTAHDEPSLTTVDALGVPGYKIGSGERGNLPFLAAIGARGKPVILSTGMYEREHVAAALAALAGAGCGQLALLHCVTSYPAPVEQVNLSAMATLRELFPGPVGYSDHTVGHTVCIAAAALGARVVEKHICVDFDVPNAQDWKVSCGPDDFAAFVQAVRDAERAVGRAGLSVQPCERPALEWALKSLVAARPLAAGTVLSADMVVAKRPGGGIAPAELDKVLGRRLLRPMAEDQALEWDAVQ
jgi:N-acetylneuraminate synthase/N,N'-diacetyllegionaminate synthase